MKIRILAALALILVGCGSPHSSGSSSTAGKVKPVAHVTPSELDASNATTYPESVDEIQSLLISSDSGDELSSILSDLDDASLPSEVTDPLHDIQSSFSDFFSTKSATFSRSLSNKDLGNYATLNSATANITVTGTTFGNGNIASDASNLKSLKASGLATADVSVAYPSGVIKAAEIHLNFGIDASGSVDALGVFTGSTGNFSGSIDYKLSASVGLSVVDGEMKGGKIIINADSKYSNSETFAEPATPFATIYDTLFASAAPLTMTVTVYNDSGTVQFTKSYATYADFTDDFPELSASTAPSQTGVIAGSKSTFGQFLNGLVPFAKKKS